MRAFAGEVLLQTFAKHGDVDANDVVAAGVVIRRPPEDFVSDLLLMDLFGKAFEHAVAKIEQQIAKPGRLVDVSAGRNPVHQQLLTCVGFCTIHFQSD